MLIIGIGNPDCGDDAAGILVARRLGDQAVEAIQHTGGALDLIDLWDTAENVVIVDAVVSGAAPGEVRVWDVCTTSLRKGVFRSCAHEFGLADSMELARALNRLPKTLMIYGIEAAAFLPGTSPCSQVLAGVDRVVNEIYSRVNRRRPSHV